MAHKKVNLPTKICVACGRPFAWRKKWARDWEAVKFCSDRCRAGVATRPQARDKDATGLPSGRTLHED